MMGNRLEDLDRRKLGGDGGEGSVSSGGSFWGAIEGNLEGKGPEEGDPLGV